MLTLLMRPANSVCDRLRVDDEHERGMIRMLVNMMLIATVGAVALFVGWLYVS
jgi:hypothetical protein